MRLRIGISALLVIATVAVFAAVRDFGFLNFDDHLYVRTNPNVRSGITLDGLRWLFSTPVAGNWHPLTMFSLMLDVEFFGVNPGAMHGVNLVIHLANTLLVFWLLALATGANGRSALCAASRALRRSSLAPQCACSPRSATHCGDSAGSARLRPMPACATASAPPAAARIAHSSTALGFRCGCADAADNPWCILTA